MSPGDGGKSFRERVEEIRARHQQPDHDDRVSELEAALDDIDSDGLADAFRDALEKEPARPSRAQSLSEGLDQLTSEDLQTNAFVDGFRTDLDDKSATLVEDSGFVVDDSSDAHVFASVSGALHRYIEESVAEVSHFELPQPPLQTLAEGGDCTERSLLYGSLLASAGIPFRETTIVGGFPHSVVEVGYPCPDQSAVGSVVRAIEDVYRQNGIQDPTVHWRYWDAVDAVFFPTCPSFSEHVGGVRGLGLHGYVDDAPFGADTEYGTYGSGERSTGDWAWETVLDPFGHVYDGTELHSMFQTSTYRIGSVDYRAGDASGVLRGVVTGHDPATTTGGGGAGGTTPSRSDSASPSFCPDCGSDLREWGAPNYCPDCGRSLG